MRWIGWLFLLAALMIALAELARYVGGSGEFFVSIGNWWAILNLESLLLVQAAVERYILPDLWNPVIVTVLEWPLIIVLLVVGVIGLLLARRGRRRKALLM